MVNNILFTLFTKEEIVIYLYDVLMKIESKEETWKKPNEYLFYKYVTGFGDNKATKGKTKNPLAVVFIDAYKNHFLKSDFYPLSFKEKVFKKINNNESLKEESLFFKEKYTNDNHSNLLDYIGEIIMPINGADFFCKYLRNMIEQYASTLEEKNTQSFNIEVLLKHILGYSFSLSDYLDNKLKKDMDKHDCIYFLVLKEFFPYFGVNYVKKYRYNIYEILEYTEQEIKEYEEKVNRFNKESYRKGYARTFLDENNIKYNGYKITELYECIDEYFSYILKTERTISFFSDFIKETSKFIEEEDKGLILKRALNNKECKMALHSYYDKKNMEAKEYWYKNNQKELKQNKNKLILYFKKNNNYGLVTINIDILPLDIKNKALNFTSYLEKKYSNNKGEYFAQTILILFQFLNFIIEKYNFKNINEIERWHMLSYLSYLDTVKNIKPSTIALELSRIRKFFTYIKNNIDDSIKDPTININISNVEDHKNITQIIPDDILLFLDNNISKIKQKDIGLIYRLLSETGWRFGDIVKIEIDDIFKEKEDSEFATIKTFTGKTKSARIKNRLGNIIEDNISMELYKDVCNYIIETNSLRKTYEINNIFFTIKNETPSAVSPDAFNRAINNFL